MYYYINNLDIENIKKFPKNVSLILRNYQNKPNVKKILLIKKECKKNNIKFYLSNNIKLAIKYNLDGAYIPSFNKNFNHNCFSIKKNFKILGSAHSLKEIRIKEIQKVEKIFISPIFKTTKNKKRLEIFNFLKFDRLTNNETVCLGGINEKNIKKLDNLKIKDFAGISFFEKKYLKNEK